MKVMNAVIAAALAAGSWSAAGHEGVVHAGKPAAAKKEQKAWGIVGELKDVNRTVEIVMSDNMRFTPDVIQVRQGDVVRMVVKNSGQLLHEIVIGTKSELDEHAALMVKFPNMEHEEPYMSHVKAGGLGEIVWKFNRAGEFDFACLMAGHYQAGMVGKIKVIPAELIEGEVRKVDRATNKITLKHGTIKSLDMPPMTMVFHVSDVAMLERVRVGEKVQFSASSEGGKVTITEIRAAR